MGEVKMLVGNIFKVVRENGVIPKTVLTIEIPGIGHDISIFERVKIVTESIEREKEENEARVIRETNKKYNERLDKGFCECLKNSIKQEQETPIEKICWISNDQSIQTVASKINELIDKVNSLSKG
jgi:predicted aldo/keto reductase-like oxidoreductase